jgi:hypothetical protein
VARRAAHAFVLHGFLLGAAAAIIYGVLTVKVSLPAVYVVANYLKLPAGAAGGLMAQVILRIRKTGLS